MRQVNGVETREEEKGRCERGGKGRQKQVVFRLMKVFIVQSRERK